VRATIRIATIALATGLLIGAPVAAGRSTAQIPQPGLGCLKTAETTAAMNNCVGAAYTKAEAELAAVYAKVLAGKGLAPGDTKLLTKAEQKWIEYRDADCSFAGSLNKGGTLSSVVQGICLVRDTIDRANALDDYLTTA
jgi:uncharacterized protein YecT (DUF1311 family)